MRTLHRSTLTLLALPGLLLASGTARAEDPVTFRGSLDWLNVYEHTTPVASAVNPGNQAFQVPSDQAISELRPNLKFTTDNLALIARPRIEGTLSQAKVNGAMQSSQGRADSWLDEAFGQWTLNETTSFAYGIQSYQWGPTEVLSPSNRLFHETVQQRNVLFEVLGKQLARMNFTVGKNFSTVVMAEVKDASQQTEEQAFQADIPWSSAGLVKSEYSWDNGSNYLGLVVGGREKGHGWVGEYLNLGVPFFDGLSVFGDASQERGSAAWYPAVSESGVVTFAQTKDAETRLYTLADVGAKFDFINGAILRGEYVLNQAGYDKGEHDLAMAAFRSANPAQMALRTDDTRRYLFSGLDLPGQRYVYGSLHLPDVIMTDLTVELRGLVSLRDASAYTYGEVDYKVGDNGTLSFAETATIGRKDAELRGYASPQHLVAYTRAW